MIENFKNYIEEGSEEYKLLLEISQKPLPKHIAIIMDGNGRWAKKRGLERFEGHKAGIKSVRETVETAARLGIKYLTLYAFSVENWKRPKKEISQLMGLLKKYIKEELPTLQKNNIRLRTIGRISQLDLSVRKLINHAEAKTSKNSVLNLNIALNYGGRVEIVDAFRKILNSFNGNIKPEEIDENLISKNMYLPDTPDPDLLIRTSGEMRISNFLIWEIAYTELYFTKVLWPDFNKRELFLAIKDFQNRERRFGGI